MLSTPLDYSKLASPHEVGIDALALTRAVDALRDEAGGDGVDKMVVVRRGKMIWRGSRADTVHAVWSVTKSFATTCLGLLIDDGRASLDQRAADIVSALAEHYGDATLRHFASMTSGYRAQGDELSTSHGQSKTPLLPGAPLFSTPGSHYAYWDSAMNQLGHMVTRLAGQSMRTLFQRRIGEAIGLREDDWSWGEVGEVHGLAINGAAGNLGQGVSISAPALARFGQFMLNNGCWHGHRLLSEQWIAQATRVQAAATLPAGHDNANLDGRGAYGLGWWVNGEHPGGQRHWPGHEREIFAASGFNNNVMIVVPDMELVVVRLGLDGNDGRMGADVYARFLTWIQEALR
jgi:CubicO group peptidase (beta-lactamase class C family)